MCRHNIKKASQPHILHRDQQMTEATVTISHHTVSMQYTNMQSTASCFTSINIDTSTTSTVTALNRHLTKYVWCTRTTKCQVYIGTVQHRPPRDDMVWSSGWERSQCAQRKDNLISDDKPNDVVEWHTNARHRWSADSFHSDTRIRPSNEQHTEKHVSSLYATPASRRLQSTVMIVYSEWEISLACWRCIK